MLAVIAKILMSVSLVSTVQVQRLTKLTTNNRAVDLDCRPNDSIAGGLSEQIG